MTTQPPVVEHTSEISAGTYPDTLTGFDEIAIATHFGVKLFQIQKDDPFTFLRALVFVDQRRRGSTDKDAHTYAMELTTKACNDYFPDDEPDQDDELEEEDPKGQPSA